MGDSNLVVFSGRYRLSVHTPGYRGWQRYLLVIYELCRGHIKYSRPRISSCISTFGSNWFVLHYFTSADLTCMGGSGSNSARYRKRFSDHHMHWYSPGWWYIKLLFPCSSRFFRNLLLNFPFISSANKTVQLNPDQCQRWYYSYGLIVFICFDKSSEFRFLRYWRGCDWLLLDPANSGWFSSYFHLGVDMANLRRLRITREDLGRWRQ